MLINLGLGFAAVVVSVEPPERIEDTRAERINDHREQGTREGDQRSEEIDELRRFVRNEVFLKYELQQIGERLQDAPRPDAVGPDAALDPPRATSSAK